MAVTFGSVRGVCDRTQLVLQGDDELERSALAAVGRMLLHHRLELCDHGRSPRQCREA
jgi:hypothetical protein